MTSNNNHPTRSVNTDRGLRLTLQLVRPADPPVPAYLNVAASDIATGEVVYSAPLLGFLYGHRMVIHPVPGRKLGRSPRLALNRMRPVVCVFHAVGVQYEDELLWEVTGPTGRWRRTTPFELSCTTVGLEFLLGPAHRHLATVQGAVNAGGPLR